MKRHRTRDGGFIQAAEIEIGKQVTFGKNLNINILGKFTIGDYSRLGDNITIEGNNITLGKHLYNSRGTQTRGLRIGGGGRFSPTANFTIGDRCTIHDNYINIAMPVVIGDDVGLSWEVSIQTHGYWLSVLEGYPTKFAGVTIEDGVIIGYRTTILPGVTIAKRVVVGACSVVSKSLTHPDSVYVGNPCRYLRTIEKPTLGERRKLLDHVIAKYLELVKFHKREPIVNVNWPVVTVNSCVFDVVLLEFSGEEDEDTDHFRDYVRKWGLRFFSEKPFRSIIK